MFIISFYSLNVKRNQAHSAEKNSRSGAKITAIFRLSQKYCNRIMIKTF